MKLIYLISSLLLAGSAHADYHTAKVFTGLNASGAPCSIEVIYYQGVVNEVYIAALSDGSGALPADSADRPLRKDYQAKPEDTRVDFPFKFNLDAAKVKAGGFSYSGSDEAESNYPRYQNSKVKFIGPSFNNPSSVRVNREGARKGDGTNSQFVCASLKLKSERGVDREFTFGGDDHMEKDLLGREMLRLEQKIKDKNDEAAKSGAPRKNPDCQATSEKIAREASRLFCEKEPTKCFSSEGEMAGIEKWEKAQSAAYLNCIRRDGHVRPPLRDAADGETTSGSSAN